MSLKRTSFVAYFARLSKVRQMQQVYASPADPTKHQRSSTASDCRKILVPISTCHLANRGESVRIWSTGLSRSESRLSQVPAPPAGALFLARCRCLASVLPASIDLIGQPTFQLAGEIRSRFTQLSPLAATSDGPVQPAQPRFSLLFTDLTQLIPKRIRYYPHLLLQTAARGAADG